jgi:hypothetical protein
MKHFKLLLLIVCTLLASCVSHAQAEFEKILLTENPKKANATRVMVQDSLTGELGWVVKNTLNQADRKGLLSTGLIKNGTISINVDNTKYNVSAGVGVVSNFDNPESPTSQIVNFAGVTGKTPAYLNTSNLTYIAVNASGSIVEQASPFTSSQQKDLILLGAVVHSDLTTINVVNNIANPTNSVGGQLHDFMQAVGALNLSGNKYTANGANLTLDKSAGTIFKLGVNFVNDWRKPHELSQSAGTSITFRYRTQTGFEGSDRIAIDPTLYDLAGVLTAVPNNKWSIQTVTLFQTGLTRIQYGQNVYNSLAEAEAALFTRDYVAESNIAANGITRAYIILKKECTALNNASDCKIIESTKFGGLASGGTAITSASILSALGYTPANDVDVVHKTGNESIAGIKTFTNRVTIAGTNAANNANATAPLSVIGGNGGSTTATTGFAVAGNAAEIKIQGGNGGNAITSTGTNIGGAAGDVYLVGGDGGLAVGGSTNLPGNGGNGTLQGGDSWGGVPGFAALKAGNNKVAGGFGSNVYIVPGWGNNTDADDGYNGTVFLGLSPNAVSVRGNTVVGGTTDDKINRLQVNGSARITGGLKELGGNIQFEDGENDFEIYNTNVAELNYRGGLYFGGNSLSLTTSNNEGNSVLSLLPDFLSITSSSPDSPGIMGQEDYSANLTDTCFTQKVYVDKNRLKEYTVATLPAGTLGDTAFVTDAVSPTYLGTLTGGGFVVCPVFFNGTNWVAH